jgi:hypothetical protein
MDLAIELQKIYDSEINIEIGWFWDGGIEVRLGDKMSGYLAEETLTSTAEVIPWFQEAIAQFLSHISLRSHAGCGGSPTRSRPDLPSSTSRSNRCVP